MKKRRYNRPGTLSVESVSLCAERVRQATLQNPTDDEQHSTADASLLMCPCPFALLASVVLRDGKYVDSTSLSKQPEIGRRVPN